MTAQTLTVLRVECVACPTSHGPFNGSCYETPNFGGVGPTPREDPGLWDIYSHEFCGTLDSQFDAWWGDDKRDLGENFAVSVYEVPTEYARVGRWQVCFDITKATLIERHRDPLRYVPLRAANLPGAGECGYGKGKMYYDFISEEPTAADIAEAEEFFAEEAERASAVVAADPVENFLALYRRIAAEESTFIRPTSEPVYKFTPKRGTTARYS